MLKNRFAACFSVIFGAVLRALAVPLSVSLSLLLVLASGAVTTAAAQQGSVRVLAVVNDDIITDVDLSYRINLAIMVAEVANTAERRRLLAPQVLDKLITDKIRLQEADRLQLDIQEVFIDDAFERISGQNGLDSEGFEALIRRSGVPVATMREQIKAQIAMTVITQRQIARDVEISDRELKAEINRINALRGRSERRLVEIFLPFSSQRSESEVRQQAFSLIDQLQAGADFGKLAQQYSYAATAGIGGDRGWVSEGALDRDLEAGLVNVRPGQITKEPVRTSEGYYIMGVLNRRPIGTASSRTIAAAPGVPALPDDLSSPVGQERLALLSGISEQIRGCARLIRLLPNMVIPVGQMGEVDLSTLPPAISVTLSALEVGEVSEPLPPTVAARSIWSAVSGSKSTH